MMSRRCSIGAGRPQPSGHCNGHQAPASAEEIGVGGGPFRLGPAYEVIPMRMNLIALATFMAVAMIASPTFPPNRRATFRRLLLLPIGLVPEVPERCDQSAIVCILAGRKPGYFPHFWTDHVPLPRLP